MSSVEIYHSTAKRTDAAGLNYKGLHIHACAGLHEAVAEAVTAHVPVGGHVLDIASGTGALCLRLNDAGYRMSACDLVTENFRLHGTIPFRTLDLNTPFSKGISDRFDAITATEIIEHLENPRHFLRECNSLLKPGVKPGGKLILTTPNVDSALSRAIWITAGHFQWFSEKEYRTDGHIMPLTWWTLSRALRDTGFLVDQRTSACPFETGFLGWWKMRLLAMLLAAVDPGQTPQGQISIVVATKA